MDAVEHFTALVADPGPEPALDVGCLAIAAGADPDLDEVHWLGELDRIAHGVDSLHALVHRVFVEEGFAGNTKGYDDPRNSLLHEVLSRKLGIPITLSVVCMEVGRRSGIALQGVGMPGHFLVHQTGADRYLDAFGGGRLLDLAGCEALFRGTTGAPRNAPFGPHLLTVTPTRLILARILENLRAVYRSRRPADLEWVLRMRLAVPGYGVAELVELGHAMGQQGRWLDGARFVDARADAWPQHAELLSNTSRALRAYLN